MAEPINLNKFRKRKVREERVRTAEVNRAKHGRSAEEKALARARREKAEAALAGKKLE